jgi:electron transfer flavoprotein alpha subunit
MSGVLVLCEHRQGEVRDVTFEMLAAGRKLAADTGTECVAVMPGSGCADAAKAVAERVEKVIRVEHELLADFNYEAYQRVLVRLIGELAPDVVMIAHSAFGCDLGPSLAEELDTGLVSDAIGFRKTDEGLVVSRGMYASKLNAELLIPGSPALVMVRQSQFAPGDEAVSGVVEEWDPGDALAGEFRTKFISIEEVPSTGIDITKAEVLVGIGRGVKEEANIAAIREFADAIGGTMAGSRPVVDAGWLEKERQVGSSGKTVKPKLYIALGISGAFQHVAGMKGADTIIAVNKDPHAPIFAVAHYGIVDDLHKVVPALKEKLLEMKS